MTCEEAIDQSLPLINELLPDAQPMGAYALGAISCIAFKHHVVLPRDLALDALLCTTLEDVQRVCGNYEQALQNEQALQKATT